MARLTPPPPRPRQEPASDASWMCGQKEAQDRYEKDVVKGVV